MLQALPDTGAHCNLSSVPCDCFLSPDCTFYEVRGCLFIPFIPIYVAQNMLIEKSGKDVLDMIHVCLLEKS